MDGIKSYTTTEEPEKEINISIRLYSNIGLNDLKVNGETIMECITLEEIQDLTIKELLQYAAEASA